MYSVSLIGVEGGNATRISRFANYLRNLLPSSDPVVMEMASKAMGHLSMAGDTFTAEYVEFEVKRALEWLGADRNEGRRHAAVRKNIGASHWQPSHCCMEFDGDSLFRLLGNNGASGIWPLLNFYLGTQHVFAE